MGLACSGLVKKGEEFLKGLCDWKTVQPVRGYWLHLLF